MKNKLYKIALDWVAAAGVEIRGIDGWEVGFVLHHDNIEVTAREADKIAKIINRLTDK